MKEIVISNYLANNIKQNQKKLKNCGKIIIILISLAILSIPLYQYAPLLMLVFIVLLAFVGFKANGYYSTINIFQTGLQGEIALQQTLKSLPDDFIALYNLPVNNSGDIDCVLVGPKGVFAIEVKNHKGNIVYSEDGWKQIKIGQGGTEYQGNLTNPGKQLLTNMHKLKFLLAKHNINVWVQPILVFTNADANIILEKDPAPIIVCKIENILDIINNSQKNLPPNLVNKIYKLLTYNI